MRYRNLNFVFGYFFSAFLFICACSKKPALYFEEGTRIINGAELYYKILGSGEPIVIVHGGPGMDHSSFLPQMAELAKTHRLIFFDQRLCGQSTGDLDSTEITLEKFVDDIEGIRQAFELGKMNLMAHSWGGLLGMKYGIKYPQNLKSLMLVNTTAASTDFQSVANKTIISRFKPEDNLERGEIMKSDNFKRREPAAFAKLLRLTFRAQFYDRSLVDSLTLELNENYAANSTKLQYLGKDLTHYDLHEELSAITCPTLIVHGDYDATPLEAIEKIHEKIGDSQVVILKQCGHYPYIETPEKFFETVRNFLSLNHSL